MIIFMGVAGSGKSSQGKRLADEKGLPWVSTGEFLRMLVAGEQRKDMLAGKLLPDQEIIDLVRKIFTVVDVTSEFILDGFPRTMAQADWLLDQVKEGKPSITAIIHLNASEEAVGKRLLARGRSDDTKAAIHQRFEEYNNEMVPLLQHFRDAGVRVIDINGEQPVDDVYQDISRVLADKA